MAAVNSVQTTVVNKIRAMVKDGDINHPFVCESEDDRFLRAIFYNYRGCRGVRLTNFGREILTTIFKSYSFNLPLNFLISPAIVVWLEHETPLPYFLSVTKIIVFDWELAVRLKMAGGDISLLMAAAG